MPATSRTPPSPPAGTLATAYRVGKGFLSDEEVAAWEKLGHPEPENATSRDGCSAPAASAGRRGTPARWSRLSR
jgi:hypothetical protein